MNQLSEKFNIFKSEDTIQFLKLHGKPYCSLTHAFHADKKLVQQHFQEMERAQVVNQSMPNQVFYKVNDYIRNISQN